jgi:hypothetical protein
MPAFLTPSTTAKENSVACVASIAEIYAGSETFLSMSWHRVDRALLEEPV